MMPDSAVAPTYATSRRLSTSARAPERDTPALALSVVIATYERGTALRTLLDQLATQSLSAHLFEVVVVDDGSRVPVRDALAGLAAPFALTIVTQANAGPAAARHRGIEAARAPLIVILDDDMTVGPAFLARHLAAHGPDAPRVVLGRVRDNPAPRRRTSIQLLERFQSTRLEQIARDASQGPGVVPGAHLYTGNVSLRRRDYLAVGGFDPTLRLSEDAELGMRLEAAGVELRFCDGAESVHTAGLASVAAWRTRALEYGRTEARIAAKHPTLRTADPWRYILEVNPVSRPWLIGAVVTPSMMKMVARVAFAVSTAFAAIGAERVALAGVTFTYGILYFIGVRMGAPSRRAALGGLRRFLNGTRADALGPVGRMSKCVADIVADHEFVVGAAAKYASHRDAPHGVVRDGIEKIGFQMMIAYRVMRLWRDLHMSLLARVASRTIRHLYGAELHWDAELAPGVLIVHGTGLVVSHAARVGPGCVLSQHVTLGESIHPVTHAIGAPLLEHDVHLAPGATLLGPITVGHGSKVAANAVVTRSIPAMCVVESPAPAVRVRLAHGERHTAPGLNLVPREDSVDDCTTTSSADEVAATMAPASATAP